MCKWLVVTFRKGLKDKSDKQLISLRNHLMKEGLKEINLTACQGKSITFKVKTKMAVESIIESAQKHKDVWVAHAV